MNLSYASSSDKVTDADKAASRSTVLNTGPKKMDRPLWREGGSGRKEGPVAGASDIDVESIGNWD